MDLLRSMKREGGLLGEVRFTILSELIDGDIVLRGLVADGDGLVELYTALSFSLLKGDACL